jgi:SAM-dependent methyltransferase
MNSNMNRSTFAARCARLALFACALLATALFAGRAAGVEGGVVPFVPTPTDVVERMLDLARVGPDDYVIDLGSGDGRMIRIAAKKYGARGFGVDIDAELVKRSNDLAMREGVADRATFYQRDIFETVIADATVVTAYLLPHFNERLRPRYLAELRPGTRIVSHDFDLGAWTPDEVVKMYSSEKYGTGGNSTVMLWVVPAQAAGEWRWTMRLGGKAVDYVLRATQEFQVLTGTVSGGGPAARIENARVRGATITFNAMIDGVRHAYTGRLAGNAIEGTVALSGSRVTGRREWSATRSVAAVAR